MKNKLKQIIAFAASVTVVCGVFLGITAAMGDKTSAADPLSHQTTDANAPVVYMTTDISAESLVKIYQKLDFNAEGMVAVKMSTGEPPNSNYLRPELVGDLIRTVNGTIVECNTAYGGSRSSTAAHKQVAREHGFYDIADVDIMDENGSMEIPIKNGTRINVDYVGADLANYDSLIALSHFKGHAMAGYGGAIKNMSIGIGSSEGKVWIHSGGTRKTGSIYGSQTPFLEAMGDAASGVVDYMDGKVVYINVMNRLSVDCDCDGNPAEPDMHDIGILASYDPVALDQACLDLVYEQKDGDGKSLVNRIESKNGIYTLEHAESIGLGSRSYRLMSIDGEEETETSTEETTENTTETTTEVTTAKEDDKLYTPIYGDASADGIIAADDAAILLQKTLVDTYKMPIENKTNDWLKYSDVSADGFIAADDAAIVLQKVLVSTYIMPAENTDKLKKSSSLVIYFNYAENIEQVGLDVDAVSSASLDGRVNDNVNNLLVMAQEIQTKTNSDIFSVKINELYPSEYREMVYVAQSDQNEGKKFTFKDSLNSDSYDTIYLGVPVWWAKLPQPMVSFLEEYDFSGKKIIPFGIHAGSRFGSIVSQYKQLQPNAEISNNGLTIHADTKNADTISQIDAWLETLQTQ